MRDTVEDVLDANRVANALKNMYSEEDLRKMAEDWINADDDEFFEVVEERCNGFVKFVDAVAYKFY